MSWTEQEESTIAHIMATETMHDPENCTGDRRILCTLIEAIRRLSVRTRKGVYRPPIGAALANATLPASSEIEVSPERAAALVEQLARGRAARQVA